MGVAVWWAPPWFQASIRQIRASKLMREGVPANVYKHAQRSGDHIHLWIPRPPSPIFDEGDIVLSRNDNTVRTIATIMAKLEDEELLEELTGDSIDGEVGYILRELKNIDLDLDSNEIPAPDPPSLVYGRSDSREFGGRGGAGVVLSRLGGRLERRRLYNLLGASDSSSARRGESLLTTGETAIDLIFKQISGGRILRISGFLALLLLFGIGVMAEIWCWLTIGGNLLGFTNVTCVHPFNLTFIGSATELSLALTGFLFVGVAVVVVFASREEDQPTETGELTISTQEQQTDTEDNYSLPEGTLKLYESGKKLDENRINWIIDVRSHDLLEAHRSQKKPIEPSDGSYVIWNSLTGPAPAEGRAWHLSGDIHGRNVDEFPNWLLSTGRRINWWIVPDLEPQLAAFKAKVRRATGYAVSSSVLGVIIMSYPWEVNPEQNPWLHALPMHEHFLYGLLAIVFTFVFLGMAWTSIGLLEFIKKSRT